VNALRYILRRFEPHGARLAEALGRLLYPPHCVACARPTAEDEDRYLCRACIDRIAFVCEPACPKCGHELGPYADAGPRCSGCRNLPLRFDRAVAAAHHTGAVRDVVLAFKFAAQRHNAHPLSKLVVGRLGETDIPGQTQLIVPVPLHRRRLRARGFNQSRVLAEELGDRLALPVAANVLRRVLDTPPLSQAMSVAARRQRVKGAFEARNAKMLSGRTVLLVDDVMTTGATAGACVRALKRAGARSVTVAVAAIAEGSVQPLASGPPAT